MLAQRSFILRRILDPWLVESNDTEPMNTEGRLETTKDFMPSDFCNDNEMQPPCEGNVGLQPLQEY
jgi:hypothetical protein